MIKNAAGQHGRDFTTLPSHEGRGASVAPAASLIDTSSEAHRHACEARHLANMPTDDARALYLAGVHQKRGKDAWERLRNDAWRVMQKAA